MSAPRIPKSEKYWKKKGIKPLKVIKNGKEIETYKNVMIFFHDDEDGILSCCMIKKYLIKQGFNILGYGIMNYQDGWRFTTLNPDVINISVDFSPYNSKLHVYVDHHQGELPEDRKNYAIKNKTDSAFEAVSKQYNFPLDSLTLHPIDMVDSAKYAHYNVDITSTLHFDWNIINSSSNPKLTFAGAINQFIKRADHTTLIEVAHNCQEPSIYNIYLKFKEFYGGNNLVINNDSHEYRDMFNLEKGDRKDFVQDGKWRINYMSKKTRGTGFYSKKGSKKKIEVNTDKIIFKSQEEFLNTHFLDGRINLSGKGYQIIGNLAFIPTGTWANAIRARAILEEDIKNGILPKNSIDFVLLQFGNTLQMVAYDKLSDIDENRLPVLKDGSLMTNIGNYMENLLQMVKDQLNYSDISTFVYTMEDEMTIAGGHGGIGSISCITGEIKAGKYKGIKYLDVIKNKIIQDISNIDWNDLSVVWTMGSDDPYQEKAFMDYKVLMVESIRSNGSQLSKKEIDNQ